MWCPGIIEAWRAGDAERHRAAYAAQHTHDAVAPADPGGRVDRHEIHELRDAILGHEAGQQHPLDTRR